MNRKNIAKVALFVWEQTKNPTLDFRMDYYMRNSHGGWINEPYKHECGTCCCFAGHGPAAGIKVKDETEWCDYVENNFIQFRQNKKEWIFLFNSYWDDDRRNAVKRASWLLEGREPFLREMEPLDFKNYKINFKLLKTLVKD